MNYLLRSKRTPYGTRIVQIVAVFLAGFLLFTFLKGPLVSLISPLWRGENILTRSAGNFFQYWRTKGGLISENESLKNKVSSLTLQVSALDASLAGRQSLETLFNRKLSQNEVVASVLTRPPQSPYDLFVIDAGASDGVKVGDKVKLPEGALLGTVSDVFTHSAKVKLFTSAGVKTPGILERGGIPVELLGRGAGNFRVEVPRETSVMPGDKILSAEANATLVGIVEGVEAKPTDAFKTVLAASPASIFTIRFVTVSP